MPSSKLLIFVTLLSLASFVLSGYNLWTQKLLIEKVSTYTLVPSPIPVSSPITILAPTTDSASLNQLETTTADLQKRLIVLENKKPSSTMPMKNTVRETVLYMGTGSSTNREWTAIDAAGITFDISSYGKVKEVRFEAALSIISGEVSARLINKTTGAVYHNSEVMHNKSSSEWRTSQPIQLPGGNNQYVVEIRSSNNERANLDGSRLKILVE